MIPPGSSTFWYCESDPLKKANLPLLYNCVPTNANAGTARGRELVWLLRIYPGRRFGLKMLFRSITLNESRVGKLLVCSAPELAARTVPTANTPSIERTSQRARIRG